VAIGAVLVAVGILAVVISGVVRWSAHDLLDPESTGANGGRALDRILSAHGVQVQVVRDAASARSALEAAKAAGQDATLLLPDSPALTDGDLTGLAADAADVVVAQPQSRIARLLFAARVVGFGGGSPVAAGCDAPVAMRSGPIVAGTLFAADAATGCYPSGDGHALLLTGSDGHRAALVDGTQLFTNATLADDGNAALAVGLLGRHRTLVWLAPPPDAAVGGAPTIGELTPPWVSPAIALLLCAGVVAGIWRGRRFGPLVAETLPVTVRAAETTEGRARLYARSRDAGHAADQLRIGALRRLARTLGLPRTAGVDEIADAAAARAGIPRGDAHDVLVDRVPSGDRELVDLSDRLTALEAAVRRASRVAAADTDSPADDGRIRP